MKKSVRLPSHIRPERYRLLIRPDLEGFIFEGEETISLIITKPTKSVILHAKELKIFDTEFQISNFKFQIKEIKYNQKAETVNLEFYRKLPQGKGELSLKFKGILNDKMRGFYRSQYMHQDRQKHIATTQFEATDARRAFPCFDEPAQKAIFDITVMAPPGMIAISNTVEISVKEHASGYKIVNFAPTPKMSTYLLAFIVGEFECLEGKTRESVAVRVFVTPGKKYQAKFALETAIKILEFYNQYFGIPYPLPVLDLIAIPDFSHGAMENWGAVTCRESALLVDSEHSSALNKQWVALVIAHELAHQWFGNLVTMRWWTDLWLNEGFASYIEYLAVDHLFPQWDIWTQFAYNDLGVALKLDALKSTHPIEVEVRHPDEIGEIFDEVSYSKGASIIRMLAGYLGEGTFRRGLQYYLKTHAYKNTQTRDLWRAFEKASGKPVEKMMQNWTRKAGYPLVRVIDGAKRIKLVQSRFFSSPISKSQSSDKTLWSIPLKISNFTHSTSLGREFQISNAALIFKSRIIKKPKTGWFKLNFGEDSFVRVDYPAQLLRKFYQPVKKHKLPPLDRLGIIRDAFALAESGDLPTPQALEICGAYAGETDYTVWMEILGGLNALDNLLYGQTYHELFRDFALGVVSKIAKTAGWKAQKGETHTRSLLRSLALYAAGSFGHQPTIQRAQALFRRWMNDGKGVNPDLRSVVYNLGAENGGAREQRFLAKMYIAETLHEEKNRLGRALGRFKNYRLAENALEFALSEQVRYQDTAGIFASVWANPAVRQTAWKFTRKRWGMLLERYPASGHMLARFVKPAGSLTEQKQGDEIKAFFKKHKAPGAERAVEQVLEKIYSNHRWKKRDSDRIARWLKSRNQD